MGVKLVLTADYLKVDPLPQAKHWMPMKSPPLVCILSLDLAKASPLG